ncbi:PTS-dependent dihydroxyacetone kinase operon transcriptional regulator DhaR [Anaerolineae bacterium CFX7]|nr:PTS-dependent dihydroxyacetone kinase operon transcriptional regulator DhaR [Anaerolineae bacterium CFX7]
MQPHIGAPNHVLLARAWRRFVARRQVDSETDPLVARSWQRSAPRLNPRGAPQWSYLSQAALARTRQKHTALLALARPLMEDVYQFIEGAGAVLLLTDNTHCVLEELGDVKIVRELHALGIRPGVFVDESRAGTNAFAVAMLESTPAQIVGAEHFLAVLHNYSAVAAPVFDLDGSLVGSIGVMQRVEKHTPHLLGIVVAAAKAIENQLSAEFLMREANERASELNAALEAISDGVLAWDAFGVVTHLNEHAGLLLGLAPNLVVGRALNEYLTLPEGLARAAASGEEVRELETTFTVQGTPRECFVSLRVLKQADKTPTHFIATLRRAEQVRQLVTRMVGAHARLTLDDIVGPSPALRRIRKQALAAANAKGSVLILGEEGTSKNALARAIHNSGKRAAGPFLALNCRAIPRDLVLSEFLGYEAGAQPGGQPSKFELAHGGTLFLDQVDALPQDMQAALVRVIEYGEVIRLGGTRVIPLDVRVMAATDMDLERSVKEYTFRRDLYYRLSPIVIQIPPLRERPEDIAALVERLLEKLSRQFGRSVQIAPAALHRLERYPFPGNITELEIVIERAALHCEGAVIQVEHLPPDVRERRVYAARKGGAEPVRSMSESETAAILAAGRAARGNLSETARTLGIGRSTLWRKMKRLGLTPRDFAK